MKDLKDAVRDARVLIALILPLGIGFFYNLTFDDDSITSVTPTVAVYSASDTQLPGAIQQVLGDTAEITFERLDTADAVRETVTSEDASIGLIVPENFDAALVAGETPGLEIVRSPGVSLEGNYVLSALEPAVRLLAGQPLPASFQIEQAVEAEPDNVIDKIGLRTWSLGIAIMMMIGLIAALAIPIVLAEEFEKKTIDALVLAMPYREVVLAKALLGLFYIVVSTALFLVVTQLNVVTWTWFILSIALTGIASLGIGLLLAGLFKNANQLNTWSGLFLTPFILPAIIIGQPFPDFVQRISGWFPSGAGMKLMLRSLSEEPLFTESLPAIAALMLWALAAYALLLWQLKRRQA
jgi:ABC-2 type transport system permease protein